MAPRCSVLVLALGVAVGAVARDDSRAAATTLDSSPPGSHLEIKGPAMISGVAPLPIEGLPPGHYSFIADGPGLPLVRGRFVRAGDGISGRAWVGISSAILPPGIAHLSSGEKRGWVFLGAGIGGAIMGAISQEQREDAEDEQSNAGRAYSAAVSEEEIRSARLALAEASHRVEDEEEIRNLWLGVLAYTWVASGIEGVLLTPQPKIKADAAGGYLAELPRAGGLKAGVRSMLVPGAGQRYMGRNGRATFFVAATAILGAGALVAHEEFLDARRDQAAAQGRFRSAETDMEIRAARSALEEAADDVEEKGLIQWCFLGAGAVVYSWNVLDAIGVGHQAGARAPAVTFHSASPSDLGMRLGATWSFR